MKLTKNDLKIFIQEGEGQKIEFKESFTHSLAKDIVAFSNALGGRIFIGVNDDSNVKGISITNKLKSQITDMARNCDPPIVVKLQILDNIIIVNVEQGNNKPYQCKEGFFLRQGANSQKLTRDEILSFAYTEGKLTFDEQINEDFIYPEDFDEQKFNNYLKEANLTRNIDDEHILINLGSAKNISGKTKLNNAGVLFFAKSPSKFFLASKVVCLEYQTNDKVNILDRKIYDDGILENIKSAINFVKRRIKVKFEIKTARRKEIPQYPEEAYREIIVNAIMHRDYFDKSADIMVEVYRNKLIVFNPGGLVKWLKPEEFGKVSKTRNPIIASLLSRTIFVEKAGTGIKRIRQAMNNAKLRQPKFEYYEHSFYTSLFDKMYFVAKEEKTTPKTTLKTTPKTNEMLLILIKQNSQITKEELAKELGITVNGVKYHIKKLRNKKYILWIGPSKGGHWEVKNRNGG